MRRSYALALAVLALLGMFSLTTVAWARAPRHDFDRMTRFEEKLDALNLDDATRTALHEAIDKGRIAQDELRSKLRQAHQDLRAILKDEKPDEATVLEQAEVIGRLETEQRKQELHMLLAVRTLLTPEQRASLREAMRPHGPWKQGQER